MATGEKKITELTKKTSVDLANDYAVINNGTSTYQMQMQKIIDAAKTINTEGIFVCYYQDSAPMYKPISTWNISSSNFVAGVMFMYGSIARIIALDEMSESQWASAKIVTDGTMSAVRREVVTDLASKANTDAMMAKSQCSDPSKPAGYCRAYSKINGSNLGIGAGRWNLTSAGELMIMLALKDKLNYALNLLGGTPLSGVYWSSTQAEENSAWFLDFNSGNLGYANKNGSSTFKTRPIAEI